MKLKSVRVKTPRDLKLMGGKARCSLWMDPDGIVHRMVELVQVNPWNLEESPIEIDVFVKIDYFAQLKDWLDRAKAWKQDKNHKEDLAMLQKDPKKWDLANSRPWDRRCEQFK